MRLFVALEISAGDMSTPYIRVRWSWSHTLAVHDYDLLFNACEVLLMLFTMRGSCSPSLFHGTAISVSPNSLMTVFLLWPLRRFSVFFSNYWFLPYSRWDQCCFHHLLKGFPKQIFIHQWNDFCGFMFRSLIRSLIFLLAIIPSLFQFKSIREGMAKTETILYYQRQLRFFRLRPRFAAFIRYKKNKTLFCEGYQQRSSSLVS